MTTLALTRRGRAARSPAQQQTALALAYLLLVAVTCGMALAGAGAVAAPFYVLAGVGFAWVAMRRSPWLYLSATLWFWLVTAFVRRVIEWRTGFNPTSIILATPNLMMLFMLKDILVKPGLLARRELGPGLAVMGAVTYGLCISFFRGDIVPGAAAAADWLAPLFYLFYIVAHSDEIDRLELHFRTFLLLSLGVTVPYGLYQYFYMPPWDAIWMISADMRSAGEPLPMSSRAFGTMNAPALLASWLSVALLLMVHIRSKVSATLVPLGIFLLTLTMVRSAWGAVTLALTVSAVVGQRQAFKPLAMAAVALIALAIGLSVVNPIVAEHIIQRFETIQDLDYDDSAQVRKIIYRQTPEIIANHPLGIGIGALGRGAVISGDNNRIHIDSGPLSAFLALGWLGGPIYILGLLLAFVQALTAARRYQSSLLLTVACAALTMLVLFPSNNVIGFEAVLLWTCLGWTAALTGGHKVLPVNTSYLLLSTPGKNQQNRVAASRRVQFCKVHDPLIAKLRT